MEKESGPATYVCKYMCFRSLSLGKCLKKCVLICSTQKKYCSCFHSEETGVGGSHNFIIMPRRFAWFKFLGNHHNFGFQNRITRVNTGRMYFDLGYIDLAKDNVTFLSFLLFPAVAVDGRTGRVGRIG